MCGLTGFWDFKAELSRNDSLAIARQMSLEIEHRGPDSQGLWVDESVGIALAHQRLAIVDLSPAGHQPMVSRSGRFVMVYNGEIFNADEMRGNLGPWKGSSDTEVILEACEAWGVEETCKKLIGMFAFALWDRKECQLSLVRDRLGIKPLYWGMQNQVLFFGSQIKSFTKHPAFSPEIDRQALAGYFRTNYIPAPGTIYQNIYKLRPGHILMIDSNQQLREFAFWELRTIQPQIIDDPVNQLEVLLKDAVKRRMVADVPLGAFLSGGIDSSTIVALMQAQSSRPIKTFSIGSQDLAYDESERAAQIAKHLGTDHVSWRVSAKEAQEVIPKIPEFYDEPFGDSSQIPTYLVSQLARQQVTVSLSGDGGDELFGGYNRYLVGHYYWPRFKKIPLSLRRLGAWGIQKISPALWERLVWNRRFGEKLHKVSHWLSAVDELDFHLRSVAHWENPNSLVVDGIEAQEDLDFDPENFVKSMQQADLLSYLPGDILTKVDRASMAVSLEARVPFLDHRVVEFAMSLSPESKFQNNQTKWVLRQVLERYVPGELTNQEKMGFGIPIEQWLRGPLRDWAENLFSERALLNGGMLKAGPIRKKWQEHLVGRFNHQHALWGVLMFQAWRERWAA